MTITNTAAASGAEDLQDVVSKALRRAWQLGQTYWRQADSDSLADHRRSELTQESFGSLVDETRAALAAPAQAVPASVIMASVMRDDGGVLPAFCLMVAYRAEKDAMTALAMLTDEPAQAAAPDMTDAYAGAREDLSIWKKRALEAEALNRKFAASVNSPSFMGEPAALAQAGEYPPLVCDYCGALTPDPWHSSGMLHGKMSKHIHSCDACAARAAQGGT